MDPQLFLPESLVGFAGKRLRNLCQEVSGLYLLALTLPSWWGAGRDVGGGVIFKIRKLGLGRYGTSVAGRNCVPQKGKFRT